MLKNVMTKNINELYNANCPADVSKWTNLDCLSRYYFDRELYLVGVELEYWDGDVKLRLDTYDCTLTGFQNSKHMIEEVRNFPCEMITNIFNELMRQR